MHRAPRHVRILASIVALALFALSASVAVAVADDLVQRDVVPEGSAVATAAVGGRTLQEARILLEQKVVEPLLQPVTVVCGDRSVTVDPARFVKTDVDALLDLLIEPKTETGLARRVTARITGEPYGRTLPPQVRIDREALDAWVAELSSAVETPAVDATLTIRAREIVAVPGRPGFAVDERRSADALALALASGRRTVELPVHRVQPRINVDDLGMAILVRRADRRLFLYEDGRLVKTYRVAVGAPDFPTPRGQWVIVRKRYMPTWGNPGSDWAADMPKMIPPGPSNPLGTRALDLDAPGIRIHGTNKDYSIGQAASHGCMRMHRWDIEDLYDRVSVGTPVFIID